MALTPVTGISPGHSTGLFRACQGCVPVSLPLSPKRSARYVAKAGAVTLQQDPGLWGGQFRSLRQGVRVSRSQLYFKLSNDEK